MFSFCSRISIPEEYESIDPFGIMTFAVSPKGTYYVTCTLGRQLYSAVIDETGKILYYVMQPREGYSFAGSSFGFDSKDRVYVVDKKIHINDALTGAYIFFKSCDMRL